MQRVATTTYIRLILVLLLAGFGSTACGQKGPLYLPQPEQEQNQEQ
ncbi:lipoprotein [Thalassolituus maritimus]|jgi:predicted small lipoprotein YifL|nr:lipoprotein [Pseudomonadota bacterium]